MPKPIFYFDHLTLWDKISMTVYIVLTICLGYYIKDFSGANQHQNVLFGYAFGTQWVAYFLNYKSMRNLKVYFFWLAIGLIHLMVYFYFKEHVVITDSHRHGWYARRNTIVLLLLYQLLRFISAKTQGQELVCPSGNTRYDMFDDRRLTFIDFLLFIVYVAVLIVLSMHAHSE